MSQPNVNYPMTGNFPLPEREASYHVLPTISCTQRGVAVGPCFRPVRSPIHYATVSLSVTLSFLSWTNAGQQQPYQYSFSTSHPTLNTCKSGLKFYLINDFFLEGKWFLTFSQRCCGIMLSAAGGTMLCEVLTRLRGLPFLEETEPPSLFRPWLLPFIYV